MTQPPAAHETQYEPQAAAVPSSPSSPSSPAAAAASSPEPTERRTAVGIGIALASIVFVAAAGLLYVRWATMHEPTCIFIVQAPNSMRGAEVTVDGVKLLRPHTTMIGAGERFAIPFYLDYGTYSVRISMNDATLFERELTFDHDKPYQRLDLSQFSPSSPSTRSAPATSSSSWLAPLRPPPLQLPGQTNRGSGVSP